MIRDIKTLPDFEAEAVRLMSAVKTMSSFDAKNEIKGILENTYIRGVEYAENNG